MLSIKSFNTEDTGTQTQVIIFANGSSITDASKF